MKLSFRFICFCSAAMSMALSSVSIAQEASSRQDLVNKGVLFLRAAANPEDGSFSSKTGPGITGLVTASLLAVDLPATDP